MCLSSLKQVSLLTGGCFLMLKSVFLDSVAKGDCAFLPKAFPNTFATSALWGFQITSQHQVGPLHLAPSPCHNVQQIG